MRNLAHERAIDVLRNILGSAEPRMVTSSTGTPIAANILELIHAAAHSVEAFPGIQLALGPTEGCQQRLSAQRVHVRRSADHFLRR